MQPAENHRVSAELALLAADVSPGEMSGHCVRLNADDHIDQQDRKDQAAVFTKAAVVETAETCSRSCVFMNRLPRFSKTTVGFSRCSAHVGGPRCTGCDQNPTRWVSHLVK